MARPPEGTPRAAERRHQTNLFERTATKVTALSKATLWPVIALICLIYWVRPAATILNALPELISRADTISLGSVVLKVNPRLLPQPSVVVGTAVRRLTGEEIKALQNFDADGYLCPRNASPHTALEEGEFETASASLLQLGLAENRSRITCLTLTDLGRSVRQWIQNLVAAQITQ